MNDGDKQSAKLFYAMSEAMHGYPVEMVIPVLITASARALVDDAGLDMKRLSDNYDKFNAILRNQITDMLDKDAELAREATRQ